MVSSTTDTTMPLDARSQVADGASKLGYTHLFANNNAPTELEKVSLREGKHYVERGVDTLDDKISKLQAQRAVLEQQLAQYQAALAPIRHVPADVLHEVFEFLGKKDLHNVSTVCQTWHEASIAACLREHSKLQVSFSSKNNIPIEKMQRWLDETRNTGRGVLNIKRCAPWIRPRCPCDESLEECPWQEPDLTALLKGITPLGHLSLEFQHPSCFVGLFDTFERDGQLAVLDFPAWTSLRSLNLDIGRDRVSPPSERPTQYQTILQMLPKTLTNLTLKLGPLPRDGHLPPTFDIPDTVSFASLKTLRLECDWDTPFILSFLSRCNNVEKLSLNFSDVEYTWSDATAKEVVLPNLHTLRLEFRRPGPFDRPLQFLRLPAIKSLTIACDTFKREEGGDSEIVWGVLQALNLAGVGRITDLKSLGLEFLDLEAYTLLHIFCKIPFLQEVRLQEVKWNPKDLLDLYRLNAETGTVADCPFLPCLQRFELCGLDELYEFDLECFLLYLKNQRMPIYSAETGKDVTMNIPYYRLHIYLLLPRWLEDDWEDCSDLVEELEQDFGVRIHVM